MHAKRALRMPKEPYKRAYIHAKDTNYLHYYNTDKGYRNHSTSPTVVAREVIGLRGAVDIKLGRAHGLALFGDASVRVWGSGLYGQTGQSLDSSNRYRGDILAPKELLPAGAASLIGAGQLTSFYKRTATNKIWAFGKNNNGNLGLSASVQTCPCSSGSACSTENRCEFVPKEVPGVPGDVVQIASGESHALALTSNGNLYATGSNQFRQLGIESCGSGTGDCMGFTPVTELLDQQIVGVEAGAQWTVAWRKVLEAPVLNPPPGEYGPGEVSMVVGVDGLRNQQDAKVVYTTASVERGGSEVWPQYPSFTSAAVFVGKELSATEAKVKLDQPPRVWLLRALAACESCGVSPSASVEGRYIIVNKVAPPSYKASAEGAEPTFVCAVGPGGAPPADMLSESCGGGGLGVLDGVTCGEGDCVYQTGNWTFPAKVAIFVGMHAKRALKRA